MDRLIFQVIQTFTLKNPELKALPFNSDFYLGVKIIFLSKVLRLLQYMPKIILYLMFLFCSVTLSSQSLQNLHWQQLTASDQLRNPSNSFLFKDSKDFLWIGSSSGLQRYDGFQIKNFSTLSVDSFGILGNNIQGQMVEDEDRNLWITTYQSLNHYDVRTERFTPYPIIDPDGTVISEFHSCGKTDNIIWLLHQDSLRQFDISSREFIASHATGEHKFNRGTVRKFGETTMVYTYNLGDNLLNIYEFICGDLKNTRKVYSKDLIVLSIYPVSKDIVLIGGRENLEEVTIASPEKTKLIKWQKKPVANIIGISDFNQQEILMGTAAGVFFRYNLTQKKITGEIGFGAFQKSASENNLLTILVDEKQNIWASTRSDGIYFAHPGKMKFTNLAPNSVVTNLIQRKNGEIWTFTNKKIIIINENGEVIRTLESDQKNADNMMTYYVMNDHKDRLWTSYYYKQQQFVKPDTYNFIKTNVSDYLFGGILLQDGQTIFLNGFTKGLFTISENRNQFSLVKIPNTDQVTIPLFLYQNPEGEIIILEGNTKLSFYNPIDFTFKFSVPYPGDITDMLSFPGDSVLWIAGVDGLVSFNYNTKLFTYHSKEGNLPNEVLGILPDEERNLWLSTSNGIYRFTPETKKVVAYNQADGIGSKRFSREAHQKLQDGRLAFGGDSGLLIFDPKDIKSNIPPAVPQITNILIDSKKRTDLKCEYTGATNIEEIEALVLSPTDNKLEFHFVSKEYSNTEDNQVRYRLFPEETEWQIGDNGGKCQYTHIEPGEYTFEIQAANSDGVWNKKLIDKMTITVHAPFYETWFFKIILFCLISFSIYAILNFLQKEKKRKEQAEFEKNMALEKERLRIARDMHDDLGSRLSAISLKTSMLENRFENPKWKKELEKLTTDAQEISVSIRETIWTVDARNDALDTLVNYLMSYAEELFDSSDINYIFNISEDLPESQMVSGKTRRMVFLAYKEILNNIVKHAKASQVIIDMEMEKDQFILTIKDNGIGFDLVEKKKGRGNGLDNMRYRMNKIGGVCQFLPVNKGTAIQLNFNILE